MQIPHNKTSEGGGEEITTEYIFGPAFNETFMYDLLELQKEIEGIRSTGPYNVTLQEVLL